METISSDVLSSLFFSLKHTQLKKKLYSDFYHDIKNKFLNFVTISCLWFLPMKSSNSKISNNNILSTKDKHIPHKYLLFKN